MSQPHVHSIKSNARREARKAGLDPDICVKPSGDGWIVMRPHAKAPTKAEQRKTKRAATAKTAKPAEKPAPRAFPTYAGARAAATTTAMRSGLAPETFVVVALPQGRAEAYADAYGFLPATDTADYVVVTKDTPRAEKPKPAPRTKTDRTKHTGNKPRDAGGAKGDTVLAMLLNPNGAAMPDICKATDWLPHTARARISGLALKHKLTIERKRLMGVTWYYASRKREAA
jgi:hypothetical protein